MNHTSNGLTEDQQAVFRFGALETLHPGAELALVVVTKHLLVLKRFEFAQLLFDRFESVERFAGRLAMNDLRHRALVFQEQIHERTHKDRSEEGESGKDLRDFRHKITDAKRPGRVAVCGV